MPIGPGKYDQLCTMVREATKANAAIVIVLGGINGSGFSAQAGGRDLIEGLPDILESIVRQIREDLKQQ